MFLFGHVFITTAVVMAAANVLRIRVDYRYVFIGSMLPDLDKPIGFLFFGNNGRVVGHTLLFAMILTVVGYGMWKEKKSGALLFLAAGVWMHLILDKMWLDPQTLLFPLLGNFSAHPISVAHWIDMLFSDTYTLGGELAGFALFLFFAWKGKLYRKERLENLLRYGAIEW